MKRKLRKSARRFIVNGHRLAGAVFSTFVLVCAPFSARAVDLEWDPDPTPGVQGGTAYWDKPIAPNPGSFN